MYKRLLPRTVALLSRKLFGFWAWVYGLLHANLSLRMLNSILLLTSIIEKDIP
ncbi:hypothetical protein PSE_1073 [Pseudovibrio sp. FO-BEG1]|nr:hypothetical protein PSE_1073 [Pseudovibrio sp. FO-BEG1]